MPNITCEHCGDTEFYKEAGFYYCSGCQIQSQEVHELVFDNEAEIVKNRDKKIHSEKSEKTENTITSWECYNYILLGLTEELINLGAHKSLKPVVRILWLRYLEKLEVFKRGKEVLPKLQAVGCLKDAEIVYGKLAKRKRKRSNKSSSDESDPTTLDSSSVKRERAKKKRALVQAHYEDYTQKSQGTSSLHNETLTSLQTGSDKSSKKNTPITYNIYASKELRRKQSFYHLRKHRLDFDRDMRCHQTSYRKISYKYRTSPFILSLNKLYAIIYLALLIIKDKTQLGDILRFIKEGHLSFNCYTHLLPEDFADKVLNFRNFKKNSLFANSPLRTITSEMADFLRVDWYVTRPNLVELCERYCAELNLPKEFCDCVKNIMSRTDIRMSFRKRGSRVPNYEGRVLSLILFVLKLLFGLDDATEYHLATYSHILNHSKTLNPKMFNIIRWLKFLEYRNIVMTSCHFPTNFADDDDMKNVDLAVAFLSKKQYPECRPHTKQDSYKHLLDKLKDKINAPKMADFNPTFTPFHDYNKSLPLDDYLDILSEDYTDDSLIHLLRPNNFLQILNKKGEIRIVNGGANDDWIVEEVAHHEKTQKHNLKESRKFVTVKLSLKKPRRSRHLEEKRNKTDILKENHYFSNENSFRRNSKRLERLKNVTHLDFKKIRKEIKSVTEGYPLHYNPYERYWIRAQLALDRASHKDCHRFLDKFPFSFRLIFKELQRIAQQSVQDLLVEYQLTELYLTYLADYKMKIRKKEVADGLLMNFLRQNINLW